MEMVSGIASGRVKLPAAVSGTEEAAKIGQRTEETQDKDRLFNEVRDEYIPEEKHEPSGRYWISRDEKGNPEIHFDDPGKSESERNETNQSEPDKVKPDNSTPGSKPEVCRGSTDKVDREIEKLKKEQKELEQKISSETDETKIKELKSRLDQVERELKQKDNDTYRRQHTVFS